MFFNKLIIIIINLYIINVINGIIKGAKKNNPISASLLKSNSILPYFLTFIIKRIIYIENNIKGIKILGLILHTWHITI